MIKVLTLLLFFAPIALAQTSDEDWHRKVADCRNNHEVIDHSTCVHGGSRLPCKSTMNSAECRNIMSIEESLRTPIIKAMKPNDPSGP